VRPKHAAAAKTRYVFFIILSFDLLLFLYHGAMITSA